MGAKRPDRREFLRGGAALAGGLTLGAAEPALGQLPGPQSFIPGFPFCLPRMAPLYTRGPPSARNSVHRTIVQLQRPSPQPALTCDRLEPLLSGHSSDTAPHLCPFFVRRASLHSPRVSLPGPVAPRSSAACRRTAAGSDALPPAGASSTSRASPAGLRFSPAAAASSSATSA